METTATPIIIHTPAIGGILKYMTSANTIRAKSTKIENMNIPLMREYRLFIDKILGG